MRIFLFVFLVTSGLLARAAAPTTQATNLTFTNVSSTSMTISWTNGDGANRIVVAREGADPDTDPSDFSSYTANTIFGTPSTELGTGNFVVYNGSSNTVDVTGLTPGETYHIRVYEYNGSAAAEEYNVNTDTDNPASQVLNIANALPPGLIGLYFDGVDDYVSVGHHSVFDIDPAIGVTYETWVKLDANFDGGTILRKIEGNAEDKFVGVQSDGKVQFYLWAGGPGSIINVTSNSSVAPNEWTHIACTFDGANDEAKIYLNGVEDISVTTTLNPQNGTSDWYIGSLAGTSAFFEGQIDELKIFDDVRSLSEIQADMSAVDPTETNLVAYWDFEEGTSTTALDLAPAANDGTLINDPFWALRVTNTLDDTNPGSLRWAITEANNDTDKDYIDFSISGGGVQTIAPVSALPAISESVIIDGYSQPGSSANTLNIGNDAVLNVQLSGVSSGSNGLSVSATNSEIYGLIVHGFGSGNGVVFTGIENVIAGCQVGLDALGNSSQNEHGIRTNVGNNTIGLPTPAGRNTIAGNQYNGIQVQGGVDITDLIIQNNYLGTSPDGLTLIGGGTIRLIGSSTSLIGGTTPMERNVAASGISMSGSASGGHQILGNYIGVGADGTTPLAQSTGILFQTDNLNDMQIGGTADGEANIIANNTNGISITTGTASTGNSIRGNIMYGNTIAIDLGTAGADTNDADDADSGNNNLQNHPLLIAAGINGENIEVNFSVDATATHSAYGTTGLKIDLYKSDGNRQGQEYLGTIDYPESSAQTDFSGYVPVGTVVLGDAIVATATDDNGNTSEFSEELILTNPPVFTSADAISFLENGTGTVIDVDANDGNGGTADTDVSYSITGGTDASLFSISSTDGLLTFNTAPDFESPSDADNNNEYILDITATETLGLTAVQTITVTVDDEIETVVFNIEPMSNEEVTENSAYTSIAPSLTGATPIGDVIYTLGGADAGNFTIDAVTGVISMVAKDFENPEDINGDNIYEVEIIATDSDDNFATMNWSVTIVNISNIPVIPSNQEFSILESALNDTSLGFILVNYEDTPPSSVTWAIVSGDETNVFRIDPASGELFVNDNSQIDFETTESYVLTITVTDGVYTSEPASISIEVEDDQEELPPVKVINVVTPNGDGKHDFLRIENIEFYADNKVEIYNRNGTLVYSQSDYNNSDLVFRGDSNIGSRKQLDEGNYFYVILDGSEKLSNGFLFIKH